MINKINNNQACNTPFLNTNLTMSNFVLVLSPKLYKQFNIKKQINNFNFTNNNPYPKNTPEIIILATNYVLISISLFQVTCTAPVYNLNFTFEKNICCLKNINCF